MQICSQPSGTVQVLYEGLALKFTWASQNDGTQKSVTCPINVFERTGNGQSVLLTLENKPGCEVFSDDTYMPIVNFSGRVSVRGFELLGLFF